MREGVALLLREPMVVLVLKYCLLSPCFVFSAQDQLGGFSAGAFQRKGGHPYGGQMRCSDGTAVRWWDWKLFLCSWGGAVQFQKVSVLQVAGPERRCPVLKIHLKRHHLVLPTQFDLQLILQWGWRWEGHSLGAQSCQELRATLNWWHSYILNSSDLPNSFQRQLQTNSVTVI